MTKNFKKALLTSGLVSTMVTTTLTGCNKNDQGKFLHMFETSSETYFQNDLAVLTYITPDNQTKVRIVSIEFDKKGNIVLEGISENLKVVGIKNEFEEYDYQFLKENTDILSENISVDYSMGNYFLDKNVKDEITYDEIITKENELNKNMEEKEEASKYTYMFITYSKNDKTESRVVQLVFSSNKEKQYVSITSPEIYVFETIDEKGDTIDCKVYSDDDEMSYTCNIKFTMISDNMTYEKIDDWEKASQFYTNDLDKYCFLTYQKEDKKETLVVKIDGCSYNVDNGSVHYISVTNPNISIKIDYDKNHNIVNYQLMDLESTNQEMYQVDSFIGLKDEKEIDYSYDDIVALEEELNNNHKLTRKY